MMEQQQYRIGPILLAPGILPKHGWTSLAAAFFAMGVIVFMAVAQPYILDVNLGIPQDEQGRVSGYLVTITEIISLLLYLPAGLLMDKVGRQRVYIFGFLLLAVGYFFYPCADSIEALYAFRMIYAVGVVAVAGALSTVLVDYPADASRGRMVALVGILCGLGVAIFAQAFGSLPKKLVHDFGYAPQAAGDLVFNAIAVICLLVAVLLYWGLKPGVPAELAKRPTLKDMLREGFAQCRNPRILLAYSSAFIARGDSAVNATFLTLWGTLLGKSIGMSTAEAAKMAAIAFGLSQIAALLWSPIIGYLADRINRVTALGICMVLGAAGNLLLLATTDPFEGFGLIFIIMLGIGQISVFLGGQSLVGQEAPLELRGVVLGTFNLCGSIGILLITITGGYLFDLLDPRAPFVIMGAICAVVAILSFYVRWKHPE